ncbi:hypothetical protein E2C01_047824 [Portunus trituberculatus]|uniref:Uncharacterized protein n=1 Tax=Portunus trituberculatus TaxID=210409 RepID=A0A5B7G230_PORTR|nr:hypothetical protein [Portunus trituberculatus]
MKRKMETTTTTTTTTTTYNNTNNNNTNGTHDSILKHCGILSRLLLIQQPQVEGNEVFRSFHGSCDTSSKDSAPL